jgi:hypothetical protein
MLDIGGSEISFDLVAKESPTQGDNDVSQCSSGHNKRMSQEMAEWMRCNSMVNAISGKVLSP